MDLFFTTFYRPWVLFIVGACVGSFINVILYRFPLGRSIVTPGSACPHCGTPIKAYDNLPILSWFILGGKCRVCKTPFSFRYVVIEALFGVLAMGAVFLHPNHWYLGGSLAGLLLALIPTGILFARIKRAPIYLLVSILIFTAAYIAGLVRVLG